MGIIYLSAENSCNFSLIFFPLLLRTQNYLFQYGALLASFFVLDLSGNFPIISVECS